MRASLVTVLAAIVTASTAPEYRRAKRRASSLSTTEQFQVIDSLIAARRRIFGAEICRCKCVACRLAKVRANGANGKPTIELVG